MLGWCDAKAGGDEHFPRLATNPKVSSAQHNPPHIPSASISPIIRVPSPGVGSLEGDLGNPGADPSCAQPKPSCGQCQGILANLQL